MSSKNKNKEEPKLDGKNGKMPHFCVILQFQNEDAKSHQNKPSYMTVFCCIVVPGFNAVVFIEPVKRTNKKVWPVVNMPHGAL